MSEGIVFQVETSRILQLIASEIYDSPYAMLRENVQNAYDAVRMRFAETEELEDGRIELALSTEDISITDNGIGMTEQTLRENFWKAGSSGKNSTEAINAGVVGTFGIGAMANFGVCTSLAVTTRHRDSEETLVSTALRENLKVAEECITLERADQQAPVGTTVKAKLDPTAKLDVGQARAYLDSYVKFLPVAVYLNGELISQHRFEVVEEDRFTNYLGVEEGTYGPYHVKVDVLADSNGQILTKLSSLSISGQTADAQIVLAQSGGQIMGFRSYFGLAPVPISTTYQMGGIINLQFLKPTAGREALQRDSIERAQAIVALIEAAASKAIAKSDVADNNTAFLNWITNTGHYSMASKVKVSMHPGAGEVELGSVKKWLDGKNCLYYAGNDKDIIATFATEQTALLQIAQNNPRRRVQSQYISAFLGLDPVPSSAQILQEYSHADVNYKEAATLFRIATVLRDDYLLTDIDIVFARISHNVNLLLEKKEQGLKLYISRGSPIIRPVIETYEESINLFQQFVKDFVRNHIFQRVQDYVPSSTRDGVEALRKHLQRSRELYRYEEEDQGELEGYLGDYLSGSATFQELLQVSRTRVSKQVQSVSQEQIGSVESVVTDVATSPAPEPEISVGFNAMPPIMRREVKTDKKLLTTTTAYPQLNNFKTFLGLSDRLMRTEADFFLAPHTMRILWAGHRVIYIFTDSTGRLSLYYDIELKNPIEEEKTGGGMFPSTTVITESRVFIPIPDVLQSEFQVHAGSREFFVRFDVLVTERGGAEE